MLPPNSARPSRLLTPLAPLQAKPIVTCRLPSGPSNRFVLSKYAFELIIALVDETGTRIPAQIQTY